MNFFKKVGNILWVNLLWLVFSIPVVTIGAATCAAYYVTLKLVDNEQESVSKQFVKAFKDNFKQGTLMWIITAPSIFLGFLLWSHVIKNDPGVLVVVGAIIYTIFFILINLYAYPLIARYENTFKNTIKNSMGIAIQYLQSTAIISVLVAVEAGVCFINIWTIIAGALFMPGVIFYTVSSFVKRTFQAIEKL